jgi:hypothetical protein
VCRHTQKPTPQLPFKAVHYGKDDNKRGYPERYADERYQRDKGHESGAPLGPEVAQADEEFDRGDHRLALNHIHSPATPGFGAGVLPRKFLCIQSLHELAGQDTGGL